VVGAHHDDAQRRLLEQRLERHHLAVVEVPVDHAVRVAAVPRRLLDHERAGRQPLRDGPERLRGVEGLDVHGLVHLAVPLEHERSVRRDEVARLDPEPHGRRLGGGLRATGRQHDDVAGVDDRTHGVEHARCERVVLVHDGAVDVEADEQLLHQTGSIVEMPPR
jgi:hypothetical protein